MNSLILLLCLTQHQTPVKAATFLDRREEGSDVIESLYYVERSSKRHHYRFGTNAYCETETLGHLARIAGHDEPVLAWSIYHTIDWNRTRYKYPP